MIRLDDASTSVSIYFVLFISKNAVNEEAGLSALEAPWLFSAQGYVSGVRQCTLLKKGVFHVTTQKDGRREDDQMMGSWLCSDCTGLEPSRSPPILTMYSVL